MDVPPEVARDFSKEVREILGYDAHGALGFFDAEALGNAHKQSDVVVRVVVFFLLLPHFGGKGGRVIRGLRLYDWRAACC